MKRIQSVLDYYDCVDTDLCIVYLINIRDCAPKKVDNKGLDILLQGKVLFSEEQRQYIREQLSVNVPVMPSMRQIIKEEEPIKFNPKVFQFIAKLKQAVKKRRKLEEEVNAEEEVVEQKPFKKVFKTQSTFQEMFKCKGWAKVTKFSGKVP